MKKNDKESTFHTLQNGQRETNKGLSLNTQPMGLIQTKGGMNCDSPTKFRNIDLNEEVSLDKSGANNN